MDGRQPSVAPADAPAPAPAPESLWTMFEPWPEQQPLKGDALAACDCDDCGPSARKRRRGNGAIALQLPLEDAAMRSDAPARAMAPSSSSAPEQANTSCHSGASEQAAVPPTYEFGSAGRYSHAGCRALSAADLRRAEENRLGTLVDKRCGAVVFDGAGSDANVLLLRPSEAGLPQAFHTGPLHTWPFPTGRARDAEDDEAAARRVIRGVTGVSVCLRLHPEYVATPLGYSTIARLDQLDEKLWRRHMDGAGGAREGAREGARRPMLVMHEQVRLFLGSVVGATEQAEAVAATGVAALAADATALAPHAATPDASAAVTDADEEATAFVWVPVEAARAQLAEDNESRRVLDDMWAHMRRLHVEGST